MENILNTLPDTHISNETLLIYKENIEIFNKFNQKVIHKPLPKQEPLPKIEQQQPKQEPQQPKQEPQQPKQEPLPKIEQTSKRNNKIESPIDLIMRLTYIDKLMKQDIKYKLIEFISVPEFSKVFGLKKSSEIMTALSKDSWNQSISLFISFLLDKHIIYKEKSYIYNKNNNDAVITVS
uniref:Uncharacterized protein n=1 Tax=viral metagenome TaxID=1070528 RepID=A0A6C0LIQ3_9ZZZZ